MNICGQTAPTPEALAAGDGCHPDKARALSDYLNESIFAEETAKKIAAPILNESNPPEQLSRLWGLLSDGMAELTTEDRHKIVTLLSHIQSLRPASGIQWADLPGFGSMWDSLSIYCSYTDPVPESALSNPLGERRSMSSEGLWQL